MPAVPCSRGSARSRPRRRISGSTSSGRRRPASRRPPQGMRCRRRAPRPAHGSRRSRRARRSRTSSAGSPTDWRLARHEGRCRLSRRPGRPGDSRDRAHRHGGAPTRADRDGAAVQPPAVRRRCADTARTTPPSRRRRHSGGGPGQPRPVHRAERRAAARRRRARDRPAQVQPPRTGQRRPPGRQVDRQLLARAADEEGYFRPDADGGMARDISSELLRKLQNEQRGFPSFRSGSNRAGGAGRDCRQLSATSMLPPSRRLRAV